MEEDLQSNMQNKCNQTYRQKKDNGNQTTIAKTGGLAIQLAKPHLKLHLNTNNNKENCKRNRTKTAFESVSVNITYHTVSLRHCAVLLFWSSYETIQIEQILNLDSEIDCQL